ncbi:MAG: MFS transporter, partial [Oligoflexia bacterium]|nr:MFS transporter [Oligoflexia bacterium]
NFNIFIPILAKKIFHMNEQGLGILWSALGIGSLIGTLTIKTKNNTDSTFNMMLIFSLLIGLTLILLALTHSYYLTISLLIIIGIFGLWFATLAISTLQLHSLDQYRGRVMSVYTLVFAGTTPIGNFLTGLLAEKLNTHIAFALNGILLITSVIIAWYCLKGYEGNKKYKEYKEYKDNVCDEVQANEGQILYLKSKIKPLTKQVDSYTINTIPIANERKNKYNIPE